MNLVGKSGRPVEVNTAYEVDVDGSSRAYKEAISTGLVWSIPIDAATPTGVDDHFFHLRNNGSTDISIIRIIIKDDETSDEEKEDIWSKRSTYIGKTIEYKGMLIGAKDVPRHPVMIRFREDK